MSTFAYAALTNRRDDAAAGTSDTTTPGVKTFVDALAALIPAEVLVAHGVILGYATTTEGQGGKAKTTITDVHALTVSFYALMAVSVFVYVIGRGKGHLDKWDWIRALIPPAAFAGWTMLQPMTAFDAVAKWGSAGRYAIAVIGAVVLAAVAAKLGYTADQKQPPNPPAPPAPAAG